LQNHTLSTPENEMHPKNYKFSCKKMPALWYNIGETTNRKAGDKQ